MRRWGGFLIALAAAAACEARPSDDREEVAADSVVAPPQAAPADVASIDAILGALYASISFAPNTEPDWARLRSLFHPAGTLTPPRGDAERAEVLSVEEFSRRSSDYITASGMREKGFSEREVARELDRFGDIAHAFSTYASRFQLSDPEPFSVGINSIQLAQGADRWWVLHIAWDAERPGNPIPPEYARD